MRVCKFVEPVGCGGLAHSVDCTGAPAAPPLDSCESRNHPGLAKAAKEDENGTVPGGATRAN